MAAWVLIFYIIRGICGASLRLSLLVSRIKAISWCLVASLQITKRWICFFFFLLGIRLDEFDSFDGWDYTRHSFSFHLFWILLTSWFCRWGYFFWRGRIWLWGSKLGLCAPRAGLDPLTQFWVFLQETWGTRWFQSGDFEVEEGGGG